MVNPRHTERHAVGGDVLMTGGHDAALTGADSVLTATWSLPALMTTILGMVGVVVGGFLAGAFLSSGTPPASNIETIIGEVIVVVAANLVLGTGRNRGPA
jgi:uncharacterized membrane protein YeaQ/YmgE (transglycosylase-associated protein family)